MDMRRTCKRCGMKQEIGQMRYHPNGKDLLCRDCAEHLDPRAKQTAKAKLPLRRPAVEPKDEPVTKYYCRKCKYKFKRKASIPVTTCPYCGSKDIGPQQEINAQSILEDASTEEFYGQ